MLMRNILFLCISEKWIIFENSFYKFIDFLVNFVILFNVCGDINL